MADMKVACYARVSTADKDQEPETQLMPMSEFIVSQRWQSYGNFVDHASATDLRRRTAWKRLLEDAAKRRSDLLLVFRLDRAFRSVHHAALTLEQLNHWGIGFRSLQEPWLDTTSPFGEAMVHITAAFAQLEKAMIAERVQAGMDRARRQGVKLGRPGVWERPGFAESFGRVLEQLMAGDLSKREAAIKLEIGRATLDRELARVGFVAPGEEEE